jgi:hypothetical protein
MLTLLVTTLLVGLQQATHSTWLMALSRGTPPSRRWLLYYLLSLNGPRSPSAVKKQFGYNSLYLNSAYLF